MIVDIVCIPSVMVRCISYFVGPSIVGLLLSGHQDGCIYV